MSKPIRVAAALTATLATSAAVGAAGASAAPKTFQQLYPVASRLCTEVAKGGGPAPLRKSAAQVLVDCTALENGLTAARAAEVAAKTPILTALATERSTTKTACAKPATRAACRLARHNERTAVAALEIQRLTVVRTYYHAIDANRKAFWAAIHALPGASNVG
jgi:hypothetical protein